MSKENSSKNAFLLGLIGSKPKLELQTETLEYEANFKVFLQQI